MPQAVDINFCIQTPIISQVTKFLFAIDYIEYLSTTLRNNE
jgi:hypothetical protein